MRAKNYQSEKGNNIPKYEVPKYNKPLVGRMKFYYKNPIADAYFSYLLAFGARGGADVGEAFYSVLDVGQYDTASWVKNMSAMSQRLEKTADNCFEKKHYISARDAYLRAYFFARAALFSLSAIRQTEKFKELRKRSTDNFRKAGALFSPAIEPIEIPYEGKMLPGYFLKCSHDNTPRPTLYVVGGGESYCEDMFLIFGIGDQERGYNVVSVDLPGMGSTAFDGMYMMPESEKPIGKVLDYILSRPDVDNEKLALFGPSMGGYTAARAAANDQRVKAVILNSIILNMHDYVMQAKELETLAKYEKTPGFRLLTRIFGSWLAGMFNVMDIYKWRWNVDSIRGWLDACKEFELDPSGINCPTLMMVGEDEFSYTHTKRFHDEALLKIQHPVKELIIGKAEMGAAGKNMLPNLTIIRQIVFDWLDELFDEKNIKRMTVAKPEVEVADL